MTALVTDLTKQQRSERWNAIAWYVPALILAAAFGTSVALGGKLLMVFAFGAMGGLALLFAPLGIVFGFFLVITFVIVGPITSMGKLSVAQWVPYMLALILLVRVPMERYQTNTLRHQHLRGGGGMVSPSLWAVSCYFLLIGMSLLANLPSPLQALVGGKLYVFIWGVFFLLVVSSISERFVENMWRGMLAVAVLQLPFALYQRVFEVPKRLALGFGITSLDAIVGTFPGGEGGGANGSLAMFCIVSMVLAISLWRNKVLSGRSAAVVTIASLVSIAVGEVKVIVVLFPLTFAIFNRKELIRRPLYFLGIGTAVVIVVGAIFSLYRDESKATQGLSTTEHLERSFKYILDPNNIRENGEVGRFAALYLWYRDGRSTPQTVLVGYGPGASQNSTTGKGVVAARYAPLGINSTTAAGMLWDIGVLGLMAYLAILVVSFFEALKLAPLQQIPPFHRSALEASAVMMALTGVMVPYDSDILIVPQFQVLFLLALFHIVYWRSRIKHPV
ncbi:MAG: hypothetical protein U1E63_07250 [Burkholderiales bacterium]